MSAIFLRTIERVTKELPGTFGVCAERLAASSVSMLTDKHEARLAWRDDVVFPAASVIKLAVAFEVLSAIDEGTLDGAGSLELRESDKVIGSGVLSALSPGLRLPIADVLYLAMAISDNTATNLLIDRASVAAVNARLARLGLAKTRLTGRLMVDGENGELSETTAAELVTLMRAIQGHAPLVALLERTQTASTIGRGLPDTRFPGVGAESPALTLAYKTGSLRGVVAEAAIVRAPRATYAIAVLSEGSGDNRPNHDNIGRVKLGEISRAVYETFTE